MDFSENLRLKIERRKAARQSPAELAARSARERLAERLGPLNRALQGMLDRLAADPHFAAAISDDPKVVLEHVSDAPRSLSCTLRIPGKAADFGIYAFFDESPITAGAAPYRLFISPLSQARRHTEALMDQVRSTPPEGIAGDEEGFVATIEDILAEFLADLACCPDAGRFFGDLAD